MKAENSDVDEVIEGNYCVGCGLCRHVSPIEFDTHVDEIGRVQARRIGFSPISIVERICPFTNIGPHEDELTNILFPDASNHSLDFGSYEALYAGYVNEGKFRQNGSSGGFGTWIGTELLRKQLVDVIVSVGPKTGTYAFQYANSYTIEELGLNSKSRYYPITIGDELTEAFNSNRVAIVGLPCFIKGIRRLAELNPEVKSKLLYAVSLVCGHLKTRSFGQLLAWQLGVPPEDLGTIDYRLKLQNRPASRYGVTVWTRGGERTQAPMDSLVGHNWGHGLFKLPACDYCDDVFGETADISIGDAWLPRYESDSEGTNIVVVRNRSLMQIVEKGIKEKRLNFSTVTPADVALSQAGGLRHRRDGLRFRLALKARDGKWTPRKRVSPSIDHLPPRGQEIQIARMRVRDISHTTFTFAIKERNLKFFLDKIRPELDVLDALQRMSLAARCMALPQRIKRTAISLLKLAGR